MGTLRHFDIAHLRRYHCLVNYVETGAGDGAGCQYAILSGYKHAYLCEIEPKLCTVLRARYEDMPVKVYEGHSGEQLEKALQDMSKDPSLFWLDAHFPGAEYGLQKYGAEKNAEVRLPLQVEVELISKYRAGIPDVVLIDDARIYQPGPYGLGEIPPDWKPLEGVERSLDFVRDSFSKTHGIVTDYADTGYVMVCPRVPYDPSRAELARMR